MSAHRILVTGGAGFIGSFIVDALVERGEQVRIFDNLEEQVHQGSAPDYLNAEAEFVQGDIRDVVAVERALDDVDTIIHCASAVGVGQSQYEIKRYTDVNVSGTANLLDTIVNKKLDIAKILVPTSMTCYGEGAYACPEHGVVRPGLRKVADLEQGDFAAHCPECNAVVEPVPTSETAEKQSATIYALTKNMQEDMILSVCNTYNISATALRLFNVYGPRQSLSNPYTGVTAIFLSRLKNGNAPVVYEDGMQSRDFVSVHDVVRAFLLALDTQDADGHVCNIANGVPTSILDVAHTLSDVTGIHIHPELRGDYRKNDVCHCFGDITKANKLLGWTPHVSLAEGFAELVEWGEKQEAVDTFDAAEQILKEKALQV